MWRAISNSLPLELSRVSIDCATNGGNPCLQIVRWRRKPRWYPVAKSKMFRVPERKTPNMAEKVELQRLHNNYKTQMRSLRLFLREECKRLDQTSTPENYILSSKDEEAEFQRCLQINEKWNQEVALLRNERLEKERMQLIKQAEEEIEQAMTETEIRMLAIEERVRREKEQSRNFITPENIDEAISQALANPVDHNFAIDINGNIYKGRDNTCNSNINSSNLTDLTTQSENNVLKS